MIPTKAQREAAASAAGIAGLDAVYWTVSEREQVDAFAQVLADREAAIRAEYEALAVELDRDAADPCGPLRDRLNDAADRIRMAGK